jgi:hypothetical protein
MAQKDALIKSLVLAAVVPDQQVASLIINIAEDIASGMKHEDVEMATGIANELIFNAASAGQELQEDSPTANRMAV